MLASAKAAPANPQTAPLAPRTKIPYKRAAIPIRIVRPISPRRTRENRSSSARLPGGRAPGSVRFTPAVDLPRTAIPSAITTSIAAATEKSITDMLRSTLAIAINPFRRAARREKGKGRGAEPPSPFPSAKLVLSSDVEADAHGNHKRVSAQRPDYGRWSSSSPFRENHGAGDGWSASLPHGPGQYHRRTSRLPLVHPPTSISHLYELLKPSSTPKVHLQALASYLTSSSCDP